MGVSLLGAALDQKALDAFFERIEGRASEDFGWLTLAREAKD